MKRILLALSFLFTVSIVYAQQIQATIGGFIAPNVFGQMTFGDVQPQVIYRRPQVIYPQNSQYSTPIYVRVPTGHEQHWARHCGEYNLCDRQVYFVQDQWYREHKEREYNHGRNQHRQEWDRARDREQRDRDRGRDRGWTNDQRESAGDRHRRD